MACSISKYNTVAWKRRNHYTLLEGMPICFYEKFMVLKTQQKTTNKVQEHVNHIETHQGKYWSGTFVILLFLFELIAICALHIVASKIVRVGLSLYGQTGTLANSEDPDEIPYNAAFHQGLHCLLNSILVGRYDLEPPNIYNEPLQVYCIISGRRIYQNTKGWRIMLQNIGHAQYIVIYSCTLKYFF